MSSTPSAKYLRKVAIIGAGGRQGRYIVDELLRRGAHEVTALSRIGSNSSIHPGVRVAHIDYESEDSLISALRGQEVLVVVLSAAAKPDTSEKLVRAAARAEVPWILPNEWGIRSSNVELGDDTLLGAQMRHVHEDVERLGKSSWIAISCGAWYEHSLGMGSIGYGFDFTNRTATFFEDGNIKISTSTWEQTARAVVAVLSLETGVLESNFKDKHVYVQSFLLSQKDMLGAILKTSGDKESDWTIRYEPVKQRYKEGVSQMKAGDRSGFAKMLYSRLFYPDEPCNFEKHEELANEILGLPQEDLNECTRKAVERAHMIASGEMEI